MSASLRTLALAALATVAVSSSVFAYSGTLTSLDGGIDGTGNWMAHDDDPTTLSWRVVQDGDDWHYLYQFSHPKGETSHFILEVSASFTEDNIWDETGDFEEIEIKTYDATSNGNSNPNMPGEIYGIKFNEASGQFSQFEFWSDRAPVWGDFYSKNGNAGGQGVNTAWNAGLTANDTDPTAAPSDGSYLGHLLVPDSDGGTRPVPEPGSFLLLGLGLAGAAIARRSRKK